MRCWNCNEELEDGSLFCSFCGKEQNLDTDNSYVESEEDKDEAKRCPFCGGLLEEDAQFCIFCGKEIPIEETVEKTEVKNISEDDSSIENKDEDGIKLTPKDKTPVYKYLSGIVVAGVVVAGVLGVLTVMKLKPNEKAESYEKAAVNEETGVVNENIDLNTSLDEEKDPSGEAIETISYDGALDAVHQDNLTIKGSIEQGNVILLEENLDICALNEDKQPMRLNQVYYLQIEDAKENDFDYENEVGAEVELSGTIEFMDGDPIIFVSGINVLKEAIHEDDIHRYEVFVDDCTWDEAYQKCLRMGGYLARINSKKEFEYITTNVVEKVKDYSKKQYYVGMRRDSDSDAYYLVDENNEFMGERLDNGYTKWANSLWLSKEPSYYDSTLNLEETCISIFKYKETNKWVMNDIPANLVIQVPSYEGKIGYICEFNE